MCLGFLEEWYARKVEIENFEIYNKIVTVEVKGVVTLPRELAFGLSDRRVILNISLQYIFLVELYEISLLASLAVKYRDWK